MNSGDPVPMDRRNMRRRRRRSHDLVGGKDGQFSGLAAISAGGNLVLASACFGCAKKLGGG